MSKSIEEFCDVCGQLLYHSVHAIRGKLRRPSAKWYERFMWHGESDKENQIDICSDCQTAIGILVDRNRKKVEKVKLEALEKDKSPRDLMEEAKSIKRNFKL